MTKEYIIFKTYLKLPKGPTFHHTPLSRTIPQISLVADEDLVKALEA